MSEIAYRRPRPDEAEAFAALHVQCWRESYVAFLPPELMASFSVEKRLPMWQSALVNPDRFIMGAYADRQPVGFIMSGPTEEHFIERQDGHIWALYIAATQHRRGIGRDLMARAVADWLARGGHSMTIGVLANNTSGRAFYELFGAKLVRESIFDWDGFHLPDCIYVIHDLAKFAKV